MRVCLFGGSFDPVHTGHLAMAESAHRALGLDTVVFLPAACSPFKREGAAMFSPEARLRLLHLAVDALPWAKVSTRDLKLPPPSWSWRLVEGWKTDYPGDELFWLMGTDQWQQLHRWSRYEELIRQLTFIVYHRGSAPQPRPGVRAYFLAGHHPASSTTIRDCLRKGDALPEGWLPQAVEEAARREVSASSFPVDRKGSS